MQKIKENQLLFSPSDLLSFLGCHHATFLDIRRYADGLKISDETAMDKLLKEKGLQHEAAYLQALKDQGKSVTAIPKDRSLQERAELTLTALKSGVDVVYQGVLYAHPWRGDADFLIKVDTPSALGAYSYEIRDTKLARTPEAKHILQLCVYADLLERVQGKRPENMHLVLGDGTQHSFKTEDFTYYYQRAKQRFEAFAQTPPSESYPEPCNHCQFCHWQDHCTKQWQQDNHLSLVANIQRSQIDKLLKAYIKTVKSLAALPLEEKIPELNQDVFVRLRSQAILQTKKIQTNEDKVEILPQTAGKGFSRMPQPDSGDLFFDMEGDPLYPNGLEYLFGVHYIENCQETFMPFWAHTHEQEREAFRHFMTFLAKHLNLYPRAHIYHYNHYETTALKRLACRYTSCEEQLDNLLRQNKFVDLYKVVRESIRTSEPGYSIKNLETFYMNKRDNAVATAADSIVVYNLWRESNDPKLLQEIADYNKVDCVSTKLLRDWLLRITPEGTPSFNEEIKGTNDTQGERNEWEIEYEKYRDALRAENTELNQRLSDLLEFHNREAKPQWWAMYERRDKFEDELIEDNECLAGLYLIGAPELEKKSFVYTYRFPSQEYKLRIGDNVNNTASMTRAGSIVALDETQGLVKLKLGKENSLPEHLSIGPSGPTPTPGIRAAIYRVADSVIKKNTQFKAIKDLLNKELPRIKNHVSRNPIITSGNIQKDTLAAITNLDESYLFIQGPPGAGKTYTCSHIIVELMRQGKKIGVAANSHRVIHNLLDKIEKVANDSNFQFCGVKKVTGSNLETFYDGTCVQNETKTENIPLSASLFAGTAWLFAHDHLNSELDYLFIDEAGQVSVANVVAMGTSAKNIILVGDQMQLGQPIQGVHPGEAGLSVLDFLLGDHATIPPERGIFLDNTRRLRPSVCNFISNAFYDGRLNAHDSTSLRELVFEGIALPSEGIHFIEAEHEGCSQKSTEEGSIIKALYADLLKQHFKDGSNATRQLTEKDILVVTPYNVQVNYLRSILPEGARVGTVDKFQGQEAPVVLISMVTSSAEDLPRNIEFLYSKNRLNVAISRAQCLAVVVANPKLLEIPCKTIEQIKLVNTFCQLKDYSSCAKTK